MKSHTPGVSHWTWDSVWARRSERHWLNAPATEAQPAEIVSAICGAHAQLLSAAELSIGLRLDTTTRTDIRHALWTDHSLIKTFGPRGTVHVLSEITQTHIYGCCQSAAGGCQTQRVPRRRRDFSRPPHNMSGLISK